MANTNGKEFNNNKFYNTKISGSNTWNVFGDIANPSQQTS